MLLPFYFAVVFVVYQRFFNKKEALGGCPKIEFLFGTRRETRENHRRTCVRYGKTRLSFYPGHPIARRGGYG